MSYVPERHEIVESYQNLRWDGVPAKEAALIASWGNPHVSPSTIRRWERRAVEASVYPVRVNWKAVRAMERALMTQPGYVALPE